jgi:hypothetical protein
VVVTEPQTYTPTAYWHRLDDEILEPRQTVTVTWVFIRSIPAVKQQQPKRNLDWRGVPFPQEAR